MTQYLILHKVRGEPKFDCAEEIEPGMWITNSGHRAYPFLKWSLTDIPEVQTVELLASGLPADWPEHFQVNDAPAKKGKGLNIMDYITIPQPVVKLNRRRI